MDTNRGTDGIEHDLIEPWAHDRSDPAAATGTPPAAEADSGADREPGIGAQEIGARDRDIVRRIAEFLVTALGPAWRVDVAHPGPEAVVINEVDGARLLLVLCGTWNERICVAGLYPHPRPSHLPRPEPARITVARDRGPEVLARDIRWRLLPPYREALTRLRADINQDAHQAQQRVRLVGDLTHALGPACTSRSDTGQDTELRVRATRGTQGRIRIDRTTEDSEVHLFAVPQRTLRAIARAITDSQ